MAEASDLAAGKGVAPHHQIQRFSKDGKKLRSYGSPAGDEELRLPDTDYSVAFWFKTSAKNVRLCEAKRYSSYNNRWSDHVVQLEGGKLQFRLQDDQPIESPSPLNDGEWHQVCTTVGEGGQRLHIDGKLIGTGKLTKRTKTSNRPGLDLGPGGGEGLIAMDEVRVFGRVLTDSEVAMLFTK